MSVERPSIYVLAGTNGAGKSSVAGATFRARGADYFNPDEVTAKLLLSTPGLATTEANSLAWKIGKRLLETAIANQQTFAFETTLGGRTMTRLLAEAGNSGLAVRMWFVGLSSPELHLERVRQRVTHGGHDIPEGKIRERYDQSRWNLIKLLPLLCELRLYDNSSEGNPELGIAPQPILLLHWLEGRVVESCPLAEVPEWAKPILLTGLSLADGTLPRWFTESELSPRSSSPGGYR